MIRELIRSRKIRRTFVATAIALVVGVCWFVVHRATSPWRALSIVDMDSVAVSEGSRRGDRADDGQLRVMTYNIAHGRGLADSNWGREVQRERPQRLRDIASLIREHQADIVILNEVDFSAAWSGHENQARFIALEAGYRYVLEQRNIDASLVVAGLSFGNAVLSRYPIRDAERLDLPGHVWWETLLGGKKIASVCRIELPDGRTLSVIPVHLEHRGESVRIASAKIILDCVRTSAQLVIVAGDFNSTRIGFSGAPIKVGVTAVSQLLDSGLLVADPRNFPTPEQLTFRSDAPDRLIDWIMMTPELHVRFNEQVVINSSLSDHRPVLLTLDWRD